MYLSFMCRLVWTFSYIFFCDICVECVHVSDKKDIADLCSCSVALCIVNMDNFFVCTFICLKHKCWLVNNSTLLLFGD